jgi:hypothetical protein
VTSHTNDARRLGRGTPRFSARWVTRPLSKWLTLVRWPSRSPRTAGAKTKTSCYRVRRLLIRASTQTHCVRTTDTAHPGHEQRFEFHLSCAAGRRESAIFKRPHVWARLHMVEEHGFGSSQRDVLPNAFDRSAASEQTRSGARSRRESISCSQLQGPSPTSGAGHPNWGGATGGGLDVIRTDANFGKVTFKDSQRQLQLSLRYTF